MMHTRASNRNGRPSLSLPWMAIVFFELLPIDRRRKRCDCGSSGAPSSLFARAEEEESPPAFLPAPSRSSPASGISGYAFFDSNGDGSHDLNTSAGIGDASVFLFHCPNEFVNETITDASGFYAFEQLHGGRYFVGITPPRWYTYSGVWNGEADETGTLLYPDADSAANPETGHTECFALGGGEDKTVSFGMQLNFSPNSGRVEFAPSDAPAAAETAGPPTASPSKFAPPEPATSRPSKPLIGSSHMPSPSTDTTILGTTSSPSVASSRAPSRSLTSSFPPAAMPSAPPSRTGDLYGPTTTRGLVLTIRGIETLENEEAWSAVTSEYVMSYFNLTNNNPGAFDVTASINVTKQTSGDDTLFRRRRRLHRGWHQRKKRRRQLRGRGPRRSSDSAHHELLMASELRRAADLKYVHVTYDQTSSYRTSNPAKYDDFYVATAPFLSRHGPENYIGSLSSLSPYYKDVWTVEFVRMNPEGAQKPLSNDDVQMPPSSDNKKNDTTQISIIVGTICAGSFFVAALVLIVLRRRKKRREELAEPVGYDIELGAGQWSSPSADNSNCVLHPSAQSNDPPSLTSEGSPGGRVEFNSLASANLATRTSSNLLPDRRAFHIIAPAGKLGVVVEAPVNGGPNVIYEIRENSPLIDQIHLRDEIIALDDEDVQTMLVTDVCKLIASKSKQERKITVLRRVGPDDDDVGVEPIDEAAKGVEPIDEAEDGEKGVEPIDEAADGEKAVEPIDEAADGEKFLVRAPVGSLGVLVETPSKGGRAHVCHIQDASPLRGQIRLGDEIIAMDDEEVHCMLGGRVPLSAVNTSSFLKRDKTKRERKITVLRRVGPGNDEAEGGPDDDEAGKAVVTGDDDDLAAGLEAASASPALVRAVREMEKVQDEAIADPLFFTSSASPTTTLGATTYGDNDDNADDSSSIAAASPALVRAIREMEKVQDEAIADPLFFTSSASSITTLGGTTCGDNGDNSDDSSSIAASDELAVNTEDWMDTITPSGKLMASDNDLVARKIAFWSKVGECDHIGDVANDPDEEVGETRIFDDIEKMTAGDTGAEVNFSSNTLDPRETVETIETVDFTGRESKVNISVPSGQLGIVLATPEPAGPAYVSAVRDDSPLVGKIHLGDRVIAVDNEDVQNMTAIDVSALMSGKSSFPTRTITVLRGFHSISEDEERVVLDYASSPPVSPKITKGARMNMDAYSDMLESDRLTDICKMLLAVDKKEAGIARTSSNFSSACIENHINNTIDNATNNASSHTQRINEFPTNKSRGENEENGLVESVPDKLEKRARTARGWRR